MNKGKEFEQDIRKSAKDQGIWILRLNDTSLSWQHEKTSVFTPNNPCDFLIYRYPYLFPIECKSTCYKNIAFQLHEDDPQAMIKYSQIRALVAMDEYEGVFPGLILNYRDDQDTDNNVAYWLSIEDFVDFAVNGGRKSIGQEHVKQYGGLTIDQHKKRVHYTYDINKMLDDIVEYYKDKEDEKDA